MPALARRGPACDARRRTAADGDGNGCQPWLGVARRTTADGDGDGCEAGLGLVNRCAEKSGDICPCRAAAISPLAGDETAVIQCMIANYNLHCYTFRQIDRRCSWLRQIDPDRSLSIRQNAAGKEPFTDWLSSLRDPTTRRRILRRLHVLESGHFGDVRSVGNGINELRFFFGAGYRVYFAEDGETLVFLLCVGDKDSQARDIQRARLYWEEYQSHA